MKLRPLEITLTENKYSITIDGKTAHAKWRSEVVDEINNTYHPELNNVADEVISVIIQEIDKEFNLSEQELREYTRTLKYILED